MPRSARPASAGGSAFITEAAHEHLLQVMPVGSAMMAAPGKSWRPPDRNARARDDTGEATRPARSNPGEIDLPTPPASRRATPRAGGSMSAVRPACANVQILSRTSGAAVRSWSDSISHQAAHHLQRVEAISRARRWAALNRRSSSGSAQARFERQRPPGRLLTAVTGAAASCSLGALGAAAVIDHACSPDRSRPVCGVCLSAPHALTRRADYLPGGREPLSAPVYLQPRVRCASWWLTTFRRCAIIINTLVVDIRLPAEAANGLEGLERAAEGVFDPIITD